MAGRSTSEISNRLAATPLRVNKDGEGHRYDGVRADGSSRVHNGDAFSTNTYNTYTTFQRREDRYLTDEQRSEALMTASMEGQVIRVRYFLETGANAHKSFEMGITAVHCACAGGYEDIVTDLLYHGADINANSFMYGTPLGLAALKGHVQVVEYLLRNRAKSIDCGFLGSALHCAASSGSVPVVKALLGAARRKDSDLFKPVALDLMSFLETNLDPESDGVEPPTGTEDGAASEELNVVELNPLSVAAYYGHVEVVRYLLDAGAHANATMQKWQVQGEDLLQVLPFNPYDPIGPGGSPSMFDTYDSADPGGSWGMFDINKLKRKNVVSGITALMFAATAFNTDVLRLLLSRGTRCDACDSEGYSVLHYAAGAGFASGVQLLLSEGAAVDGVDKDGRTALIRAALGPNEEEDARKVNKAAIDYVSCVQRLLQSGADPNKKDNNGDTALLALLKADSKEKTDHVTIFHALAHAGADLEVRDSAGKTAFMYAVTKFPKIARALLQDGAKYTGRFPDGNVPVLHVAVETGDVNLVTELLSCGADACCKDDKGKTPLLIAASKGREELVKCLLSHGAAQEINATTSDGGSALMSACENANANIVNLLLQAGAKPTKIPTGATSNPLCLAVTAERSDIVRALLKYSASQSIPRADGWTPLHIAADMDAFDSALALIESGADVNATDQQNRTPLSRAAEKGNVRVAEMLLLARANSSICDKDSGYDAAKYAVLGGHLDTLKLLARHGASMECRSRNGATLVMTAALTGKVTILRFLIEQGCNVNARNDQGENALLYAGINGLPEQYEIESILRNSMDNVAAARPAALEGRRSDSWSPLSGPTTPSLSPALGSSPFGSCNCEFCRTMRTPRSGSDPWTPPKNTGTCDCSSCRRIRSTTQGKEPTFAEMMDALSGLGGPSRASSTSAPPLNPYSSPARRGLYESMFDRTPPPPPPPLRDTYDSIFDLPPPPSASRDTYRSIFDPPSPPTTTKDTYRSIFDPPSQPTTTMDTYRSVFDPPPPPPRESFSSMFDYPPPASSSRDTYRSLFEPPIPPPPFARDSSAYDSPFSALNDLYNAPPPLPSFMRPPPPPPSFSDPYSFSRLADLLEEIEDSYPGGPPPGPYGFGSGYGYGGSRY